ncbi:hypothetical protein KW429_20855 [Vibrio fluvialis]|nr:hypothetical protein [Vibrio fluvialis]
MNHKPSFLVILSLIFIAGFSLRPGITSIAPALSEIQTHFQVPESLLGLLTAIPVMCMGVLSPLAHWAAQRAGIKMTLLIGFMLVAVGETLRVQTYWFSVLLFTSLLVGIGDALISASAVWLYQAALRAIYATCNWLVCCIHGHRFWLCGDSDHAYWLRFGRF